MSILGIIPVLFGYGLKMYLDSRDAPVSPSPSSLEESATSLDTQDSEEYVEASEPKGIDVLTIRR